MVGKVTMEMNTAQGRGKTSGKESQPLLRGVPFPSQGEDCQLQPFRARSLEGFKFSLRPHDQLSPTVICAPRQKVGGAEN